VVLLGGGEYACVFANASYAMDSLGADGSLVTSTRPMSLKDTPLNPLRNFQCKLSTLVASQLDVLYALYTKSSQCNATGSR